jgi:hypothetical protein
MAMILYYLIQGHAAECNALFTHSGATVRPRDIDKDEAAMIYRQLCFRECRYTLSHFSWLLNATEEERSSLLPLESQALVRMRGSKDGETRMET